MKTSEAKMHKKQCRLSWYKFDECDLPHFSGGTVIKPSIVDDNVIPLSDAVPLISVPSSDQLSCTKFEMCSEHIR